jgi:hypothetical protein
MGYEKSKIYKLQHEDGHFYIGSTINELRVRFQQHRCCSKTEVNRTIYNHINGEWDKVRIILIEAFECTNRSELNKKEDEYIQKELDNPLCLNRYRAFQTDEEYKKYKKEYLQEYGANYYQKNKEHLAELRSIRKSLKPHFKTSL